MVGWDAALNAEKKAAVVEMVKEELSRFEEVAASAAEVRPGRVDIPRKWQGLDMQLKTWSSLMAKGELAVHRLPRCS